jgi:hypothetical protein
MLSRDFELERQTIGNLSLSSLQDCNFATTNLEDKQYFVTCPITFGSSKSSRPTNELVVSLVVSLQEYWLKALADTCAISKIILDEYTTKQLTRSD